MQYFKPDRPSRTITARDLRKGDQVNLGTQVAIVSNVELTDGYIFFHKSARALKVSFLNHEPILAHPGHEAELVENFTAGS
jgi:hypothetical protein